MQMRGVRRGRAYYKKHRPYNKKKAEMVHEDRLANKESRDRRSNMTLWRQEPRRRSAASAAGRKPTIGVSRGKQDVGMAHPRHRTRQHRRGKLRVRMRVRRTRLRALEPHLNLDTGDTHRARTHHAPVRLPQKPVPAPATCALTALPLPPSLHLLRVLRLVWLILIFERLGACETRGRARGRRGGRAAA
jgi:hypothetical protein